MSESSDTNDDEFKLDKDQVDALRLEAQSISPKEQAEFEELIANCNHMVLDKFEAAITDPVSDQEMARRFVIADGEGLQTFLKDWTDKTGRVVHSYNSDDSAGGRAFAKEGGLVVIPPKDLWSDGLSEEDRERFARRYQGKDKAKNLINTSLRVNMVIHEITHLYQRVTPDNDPPLWFTEVQAYWAGREAAPEAIQFHWPFFDKAADFYQKLVDKYGANEIAQHGFYNGKNAFISYKLEKEFTPEVQKEIFPDYSVKEADK